MAHHLSIPGFPTFHVVDLRQRADLLSVTGHQAEGALLHALLDGYLAYTASATEAADHRRELRDLESSADEAEKRAEDAATQAETLLDAATEAVEALTSALGSLQRGRYADARGNITEALSVLAAAVEDAKK